MVYLKDIHGILNYGEAVQVGMNNHISDVTMYEQVTGSKINDLGWRNPAVGAADPKVFRLLSLG